MRKIQATLRIIVFCCLGLMSCNQETPIETARPFAFTMLNGNDIGLQFTNEPEQSSEFNVFNYMYFFNGGGTAAGDFNQDGRIDLYFTSNMGKNKLFLNEGDLSFRDVSAAAGIEGSGGWKTGASVVDINQDGLLDIYVSQMGDFQNVSGKNQLFICQGIEDGIPTFKDQADAYGLDLVLFGTQSSFFDYDLDGDLDLFLLNHSLHANGTFGKRKVFDETHPKAGDRLFRNDNGTFTDVTRQAGIFSTVIGYGLGIATGDINLDGWPDIYIGNDFHENDYLYLNQQDGTFKEVLNEQIRHTSRFSMGVDMADLNNDAYSEIISLDMLPEDPFILKSSLAEDSYSIFNFKLSYGYNHQYSRNNLQLNHGDNSFSEIGIFSGVFASDWSWAPIFLDFNHDGWKDLFISNGIPRRMNDIDYINFRANNEFRWKQQTNNLEEDDLSVIEKMPQIKLKNKFYQNLGNLRFEDIESRVDKASPTFSNSAVAIDLDNDGDLDIVTNNIYDAPSVYKNLLMEGASESPKDYLSLDLEGTVGNRDGIGTRAILFKGDDILYFEYFPVRGYQSSTQVPFHIPVGDKSAMDSILLVWPDQSVQRLDAPDWNTTQEIRYDPQSTLFDWSLLKNRKDQSNFDLSDQTTKTGLDYVHQENDFIEFNREGLIPFMVSAEGPGVAIGDLNQDGLTDIFLGSSKRFKSAVYYQQDKGQFKELSIPALGQDSLFEDVDAKMADFNGDGLVDIVVASGGNEYWGEQSPRQQRLYWNKGNEIFQIDTTVFAEALLTAATVQVADINGDKLPDIFFGARAEPWNYGQAPTSFLYINQGDGTFREVAKSYAPGLSNVGMIRSANFADVDQNGYPDLVLAMDWGPVIAFMNQNGRLRKKVLWEENGWWNVVRVCDPDQDGDMDLLVGGTGANAKLQPSAAEPVRLYINDFDDNNQIDQILTYYLDGKEYPFATFAELTKQLPPLKKKYLYSKDLARANLTDIFGDKKLAKAKVLQVEEARHLFLENVGDGTYTKHLLPDRLQLSTVNDFCPIDLDGDGKEELVVGGNFYRNNIEMGRYDANQGHVLEFLNDGTMSVKPLGDIRLEGVVQRILKIPVGGEPQLLIVKNDGPVQLLKPVRKPM